MAEQKSKPPASEDLSVVLDVPFNKTPSTPTKSPSKTPAFQALNAGRYRRQELIKLIEAKTKRQFISYVGGQETQISRDDTLFFVDLLHNVRANDDTDFLLHTPGGDMDAAEKIIEMVRKVVGRATLRVVVPDFAKSAGTLIALGADLIVMSDSSELGPIDPQVSMQDTTGTNNPTPVQNYIDAYEAQASAVRENPTDTVAQIMLKKFDPARLHLYRTAIERARKIAEKQLKFGMFRKVAGNFTAIPSRLLDTKTYLSHAQVIGCEEALDIGLLVEYHAPDEETWQLYWQLYCHQRMDIRGKDKLYESRYASIHFPDAC